MILLFDAFVEQFFKMFIYPREHFLWKAGYTLIVFRISLLFFHLWWEIYWNTKKEAQNMKKVTWNTLTTLYTFCFSHFVNVFAYFAIRYAGISTSVANNATLRKNIVNVRKPLEGAWFVFVMLLEGTLQNFTSPAVSVIVW